MNFDEFYLKFCFPGTDSCPKRPQKTKFFAPRGIRVRYPCEDSTQSPLAGNTCTSTSRRSRSCGRTARGRCGQSGPDSGPERTEARADRRKSCEALGRNMHA